MAIYRALAILTLTFASFGCATITSSEMQSVTLSAVDHENKPVEGAACKLQNDRGSWETKSPGIVSVRRSSEDLSVECSKEGHPNGILRAISRAAAGMFGNIIFGGGIGAIIDHNKGTGYNYPDALPVEMGKVKVVDRQGDSQPAQPNSSM